MISSLEFAPLLHAPNARATESLLLLGASGSVGSSCVEYLKRTPSIKLTGVSVHGSIQKLISLIKDFPVQTASITDEKAYDESFLSLTSLFPNVKFYRGVPGTVEMIHALHDTHRIDTVLTAVVGASGIRATIAALECGLKIALANKETMVSAGPVIEALLRKQTHEKKISSVIPVDSEHSAIFQLGACMNPKHIHRVVLTASGGPFYNETQERIGCVTREDVLNHPTWSMGPKISVDSAGMINKGLEVIEAHHLFSLPYSMLDVVIHQKSLIHSMIRTTDGAFHLQGSPPNMIFPIAYALHYPDPVPTPHQEAKPPFLWDEIRFMPLLDDGKFPGFFLALEAGKKGGTAPALFNAVNEELVSAFLEGIIEFTDIPRGIEMALSSFNVEYGDELELYIEADGRARAWIKNRISSL